MVRSRHESQCWALTQQDEDLLKRDYTGAVESQVDMSMLPKVMQVRDFGKVRSFLHIPSTCLPAGLDWAS